ncbi:MAG: hypothetical protein KAW52_05750 [candidate division Zixibacteria bacterium]|nr:hypothetical protein [candidate division Zixibacteria bacterium]
MGQLKKIVRISFLLLLGAKLSFAQPTLGIPHFDIYAHDENLAKEVKTHLESSYQRISSFLDDTLTQVISVYVVDSDEEFRSLIGGGFPDWGIGCAIPRRNIIVLKSPLHFNYHRPFSELVAHELAHIFLGNLAKGVALPRWLDEGFAMHQSHEWRIGQDVAVARAVLTGSLLRLSEIESVNAFREKKAQLAYTESFLAVSYLAHEYGEEAIRELVEHLASGTSKDLAFLNTIGSNYLTFQLEFETHIKSKYSWISFFGDTFLLWMGLAFLIVFLYFVKKRHTKKVLKEWELEERGIKRMSKGETTDEFS